MPRAFSSHIDEYIICHLPDYLKAEIQNKHWCGYFNNFVESVELSHIYKKLSLANAEFANVDIEFQKMCNNNTKYLLYTNE